MMDSLSPQVRRFAAVGLLLLLILALVGFVLEPVVLKWSSNVHRIERERLRLMQLGASMETSVSVTSPELESRRRAVGDLQVRGQAEAQQHAALQEALRALAQRSGIRVQSLRTIPTFERDGVHLVGAHVNLTSSLDSIQKLILDIETSRPLVFVDGLEISSAVSRDRSAKSDVEMNVVVRLAAPVPSTASATQPKVEEKRQ
jgi:Type II secretion system (T2SS), protein M subtype b